MVSHIIGRQPIPHALAYRFERFGK